MRYHYVVFLIISTMTQIPAIGSAQTSFGIENFARPGAQKTENNSGARSGKSGVAGSGETGELTPEEQQEVQQLKQADRKVRAHEQAHLAAGAGLVRGGPSYTYQLGPDNQRYAVSGEVSIDVSPGRTPKETIPKAQQIRAAALAPADPSPQDHSVAAKANRLESDARIELAIQQRDEAKIADPGNSRLYQNVEQGEGENDQLGGRLDLFA